MSDEDRPVITREEQIPKQDEPTKVMDGVPKVEIEGLGPKKAGSNQSLLKPEVTKPEKEEEESCCSWSCCLMGILMSLDGDCCGTIPQSFGHAHAHVHLPHHRHPPSTDANNPDNRNSYGDWTGVKGEGYYPAPRVEDNHAQFVSGSNQGTQGAWAEGRVTELCEQAKDALGGL